MQERRQYDRRTGVAMLSLVAATNVVPWMELLLGRTATADLLAPSEIRVAVGSCFLAVAGRCRSSPGSCGRGELERSWRSARPARTSLWPARSSGSEPTARLE